MTDVFISGGGVFEDQPLPQGTRIRMRPSPNEPACDVEVFVRDGHVHVVGHYKRLTGEVTGPNRVEVWTVGCAG